MKVRGTFIFGGFTSNLGYILFCFASSSGSESGIASVYSGEKTANGEYAHADRLHGGPPHAAVRHPRRGHQHPKQAAP